MDGFKKISELADAEDVVLSSSFIELERYVDGTANRIRLSDFATDSETSGMIGPPGIAGVQGDQGPYYPTLTADISAVVSAIYSQDDYSFYQGIQVLSFTSGVLISIGPQTTIKVFDTSL